MTENWRFYISPMVHDTEGVNREICYNAVFTISENHLHVPLWMRLAYDHNSSARNCRKIYVTVKIRDLTYFLISWDIPSYDTYTVGPMTPNWLTQSTWNTSWFAQYFFIYIFCMSFFFSLILMIQVTEYLLLFYTGWPRKNATLTIFFLSYGIFKCLVDVVCRLHTVVYSLLGWTTRGRHHTPVFRMFDWPLHRDFSLLFAIGEVGSFTCIGCDSPIHGTDGLESPPKDLAMRIKRLAKGRYCRGGIWTHAEPPVWKFAVYTLALRPLGHDSSSITNFKEIRG